MKALKCLLVVLLLVIGCSGLAYSQVATFEKPSVYFETGGGLSISMDLGDDTEVGSYHMHYLGVNWWDELKLGLGIGGGSYGEESWVKYGLIIEKTFNEKPGKMVVYPVGLFPNGNFTNDGIEMENSFALALKAGVHVVLAGGRFTVGLNVIPEYSIQAGADDEFNIGIGFGFRVLAFKS